jgi:hypothetical protein
MHKKQSSYNQEKSQKLPYGPKRFSGSVSGDECSVPCTLTAQVDFDGTLQIDFEEIPVSDQSADLFDAVHVGTKLRIYSLTVQSDDGDQLISDKLTFNSSGKKRDEEGYRFKLIGRCSKAKIFTKKDSPEDADEVLYYLRGFECFRPLRCTTQYGKIEMKGSMRSHPSKLTGYMRLETHYINIENTESRDQIMNFFEHVIFMMSFASGTMLREPLRIFVYGNTVEMHVGVRGLASQALWPPFH